MSGVGMDVARALAAIFHGIKGRVLRGAASNAQAAHRAEAFPRLARLAREAMEAC